MGLDLIVGLGNPGGKYDKTRHNAGFWFITRLAQRYHLRFRTERKFQGETASFLYAGREIRLLKPMTYMNKSGLAVAAVMQYYKIPVTRILIAHDELDLPAGIVRLKSGGGHGGHNGLRDISALGSSDFWRLRIGIGHPGHKDQVLNYVLNEPSQADRQSIEAALMSVEEVTGFILEGEMEKAMHVLHSR